MKPRSLDLHIQELVLLGFASGDRYSIGEAIRRELVTLLAERDLRLSLSRKKEIDRVDCEASGVSQDCKTETIGAHIAQAVYRGLAK